MEGWNKLEVLAMSKSLLGLHRNMANLALYHLS